jgi:hypothetical protein
MELEATDGEELDLEAFLIFTHHVEGPQRLLATLARYPQLKNPEQCRTLSTVHGLFTVRTLLSSPQPSSRMLDLNIW